VPNAISKTTYLAAMRILVSRQIWVENLPDCGKKGQA